MSMTHEVCAIRHTAIGFGVSQISLWCADFKGPAAVVWYEESGRTLRIIHTFTVATCRRRGYCRRLYDTLATWYPQMTHFVTADGTPDGGRDFLVAYGFHQEEPHGWIKRIERDDPEKNRETAA